MALAFGTSGLRGLVSEMTDLECYLYTTAFLIYLKEKNYLIDKKISIAGDLRKSTDRILNAVAYAITDLGYEIDYCGKVSTPALFYYASLKKRPSMMITGSHIPEDRNGIKFHMPNREVLKEDEIEIIKNYDYLKLGNYHCEKLKDFENSLLKNNYLPQYINKEAVGSYVKRYTDFFQKECFKGMRILIYQHSSVARDILPEIFSSFGAEITKIGFSENSVPIDTEAIRSEDIALIKKNTIKYEPNATISADSDGDRPMLFDENGKFVGGDILGILASVYLKADSVSMPISCNSSVEKLQNIGVSKTKIGSPYVISSMYKSIEEGYKKVVGYEANGGFLLATPLSNNEKILHALPTRDSVLPILCSLLLSIKEKIPISKLVSRFSFGHTHSDLIREFPREKSMEILQLFSRDDGKKVAELYFGFLGGISKIDYTDGVRMIFNSGEIIHIRQSGNAPELRCYTESKSEEKAKEINKYSLDVLKSQFK